MDVAAGGRFAIRPQAFGDEGTDLSVTGGGKKKPVLLLFFPQKSSFHKGVNAGGNFLPGEIGIGPVNEPAVHRMAGITLHQQLAYPVENIFIQIL
jgi:hypothetical protein